MAIELNVDTLVELYHAGHFQEMEAGAQQLTQAQPELGMAWKILGIALCVQGKPAISEFQTAAILLPQDADVHNNLAVALHGDHQLEAAKNSYLTALRLNPKYAEALCGLGNVAVGTGDFGEAIKRYEEAIAISPTYAQAINNLGHALRHAGQTNRSVECLERATRIAPGFAEAHANLGISYADVGALDKAIFSLERAIEINPGFASAMAEQGKVLLRQQKYIQAIEVFQRCLRLDTKSVDAYNGCGAALLGLRRHADSIAAFEKALHLNPAHAEALNNIGNAYITVGKFDLAVECLERALVVRPDYVDAQNNLGVVLQKLGRAVESNTKFQEILSRGQPDTQALNNLGVLHKTQGELQEAMYYYKRALELDPTNAEAHCNLGSAYNEVDEPERAAACFHAAIALRPNFLEARLHLGNTLHSQGRPSDAIAIFQGLLAIEPAFAAASLNLGNVFQSIGRHLDAIECYQRVLAADSGNAGAHCNYGIAMQAVGHISTAISSFNRAIELQPQMAEAHLNLANALQSLGDMDGAFLEYRSASKSRPYAADWHSNFLFCLGHREGVEVSVLRAEHIAFAERFEGPLEAHWPKHKNVKDPNKKLRVGIVSADFRNHAIANFIEPVLNHLRESDGLSLYAYCNHAVEDAVTQRLKGLFDRWNSVIGLTEQALSEKVQEDEVDILIDLSGHTAHNRLLAFARKPAPVQLTWMGFPGTTGLKSMDYYISDKFCLPPGKFDDQFTEKIVRLPASAPFLPSASAPDVNSLPALKNGFVTFGSFNRLNKISRSVVRAWAEIMRSLPDSHMVFGAMPKDGESSNLKDWLQEEGIDLQRLKFYPSCEINDYLTLHHEVDICLDTFPYNGGTTTLNALWMGVPTITLAGATAAGRTGAAVLGHAGLFEFLAESKEDYIAKAISWSSKLKELASVRAGLRDSFRQSAMGRPIAIAKGLEAALRIMWQRWCNGLPSQTFEVEERTDTKDASRELPHAEIQRLVQFFSALNFVEMERLAQQLVVLYPNAGVAWKALGVALQAQEKEALFALQQAVKLFPQDAEAHNNLGLGLKAAGQLALASNSYRNALQLAPGLVDAHLNLGNVCVDMQEHEAAISHYQRALELAPNNPDGHNNLGTAYQGLHRNNDALLEYQMAVKLRPGFAEAWANIATVEQGLGRWDEAEKSYRMALASNPHRTATASSFLFFLGHREGVEVSVLRAEHIAFAERFEGPLEAHWPKHKNVKDPNKKLRVGIVSADFRNHAIANFIEPVLNHLRESDGLSLYAYCNHAVEDAVTQRLKGLFDRWNSVIGLTEQALSEKVQEDEVDILIDLSGHTAHNRLLAFARKPAPVQLTWMGFPGTTGLKSMDYYISDKFCLPPGKFDDQFTEKIVRLPASAPFLPSASAPDVNSLPALKNGFVTFGSFNRLNKISRSVVRAWAEIMRSLPDSHMVFGAMPKDGESSNLKDWLQEEGIDLQRLKFYPSCEINDYLTLHHEVDICLDTFPYNGGTTTLNALWMGVPTITLAGATAAGRTGAAVLGHAGLFEFLAESKEDYIAKAISWSSKLKELASVRAGLRDSFRQSAMGRPIAIAKGLEAALRIMWQRWCNGLPSQTFEVEERS